MLTESFSLKFLEKYRSKTSNTKLADYTQNTKTGILTRSFSSFSLGFLEKYKLKSPNMELVEYKHKN